MEPVGVGRWGCFAVGGELKGLGGVTESQMDLLAVERVAGALGYGLFGHLFVGECDQGLAAALATEVVQNENGVWLELQGGGGGDKNQTVSGCL